ncbi:MAG: M13 family metallopeptidase [Deltaproteobacteria bacterium]|nr:M13 family metallopeptidase [Deltaproteobacteria bacterium]
MRSPGLLKRVLPWSLLGLVACGEDSAVNVDLALLDESVDPCDNFYQYACGGWIAQHPVGASGSGESRFNEPFYEAIPRLRSLIATNRSTQAPFDYGQGLVGSYHKVCMKPLARADGVSQLRTMVADLRAVESMEALAERVATQSAIGSYCFFGSGSRPDYGDGARNVPVIIARGVELPDRVYYLDAEHEELRARYRDHIRALSTAVLGTPLDPEVVLEVETTLARAMPRTDDPRTPGQLYHPMSTTDLASLAPSFPWEIYWAATGWPGQDRILVHHPEYLRALEQLFASTPLQDLLTYMAWQLLQDRADDLTPEVLAIDFNFWRIFDGRTKDYDLELTCFLRTLERFDDVLARQYVSDFYDQGHSQIAQEMSLGIVGAFHARLDRAAWLDDSTRAEAKAKLEAMRFQIGHPMIWPNHDPVTIDGLSFLEQNSRLSQRRWAEAGAGIGMTPDGSRWFAPILEPNAYYSPTRNAVTLPALILTNPFLNLAALPAHNSGALGTIVAHELTHGFDDQGRHYDAQGGVRDWWSSTSSVAFAERAQCLEAQFNAYPGPGGQRVNGELTLGENLADLGGLITAYEALMAAEDVEGDVGFDGPQVFFLSYAQSRCEILRPELSASLLLTDPHAPMDLRVNGTVSNLPEFADAFDCPNDAPMVRANVCQVW